MRERAPYRGVLEDILLTERTVMLMRRDADSGSDISRVISCRQWQAAPTAGWEPALHLTLAPGHALASTGDHVTGRAEGQPGHGRRYATHATQLPGWPPSAYHSSARPATQPDPAALA